MDVCELVPLPELSPLLSDYSKLLLSKLFAGREVFCLIAMHLRYGRVPPLVITHMATLLAPELRIPQSKSRRDGNSHDTPAGGSGFRAYQFVCENAHQHVGNDKRSTASHSVSQANRGTVERRWNASVRFRLRLCRAEYSAVPFGYSSLRKGSVRMRVNLFRVFRFFRGFLRVAVLPRCGLAHPWSGRARLPGRASSDMLDP